MCVRVTGPCVGLVHRGSSCSESPGVAYVASLPLVDVVAAGWCKVLTVPELTAIFAMRCPHQLWMRDWTADKPEMRGIRVKKTAKVRRVGGDNLPRVLLEVSRTFRSAVFRLLYTVLASSGLFVLLTFRR